MEVFRDRFPRRDSYLNEFDWTERLPPINLTIYNYSHHCKEYCNFFNQSHSLNDVDGHGC